MPTIVQAYKCDYCNMTSIYKSSVVRHENKSCKFHRSCGICRFYSEEQETIYNPYHGGDPGSTDYEVVIMWCGVDEIEIGSKKTNCPKFQPRI